MDAKVFIEKAKDAIAEQRRKKHEAGQGGDNGKDVDDQTMNIVVVAEIDLTARKFRVTGAKVGPHGLRRRDAAVRARGTVPTVSLFGWSVAT